MGGVSKSSRTTFLESFSRILASLSLAAALIDVGIQIGANSKSIPVCSGVSFWIVVNPKAKA